MSPLYGSPPPCAPQAELAIGVTAHTEAASRGLQIFVLITLYSLSNFLMLLNHGVFWDDWIWVHLDRGTLLNGCAQLGYPLLGYLHLALRHLGIEAYRGVTFVAFLVASVAVFGTLCRIEKLNDRQRLFLALVFALFPANSSRIAICTVHSSIAYAVFFAGVWLFAEFTVRGTVRLRLSSLALIALASYFVNSLLFFCILVPVFFVYVGPDHSSVRAVIARLRRIPEFLILPPAVFSVKLLSKPFGEYAGYNDISLRALAGSPRGIAVAFKWSFIREILHCLRLPFRSWTTFCVTILLVAIIGWLLRRVQALAPGAAPERFNVRGYFFNLLVGASIFVLAVMPYLAVGKIPGVINWGSRHQLLEPLAAAWLIVFGLDLPFGQRRVQAYLLTMLLAIFMLGNIDYLTQFQADAYKQESLLCHFRSNPAIREGNSFVVDDQTHYLDANERTYAFYEYSGMFYLVFGRQTRYATNLMAREPFADVRQYLSPFYLLSEFHGSPPDKKIVIAGGPYGVDKRGLVRLMFDERRNPERYEREIWDITRVTVAEYRLPDGRSWASGANARDEHGTN
jgi:hypothetical protein